MRQIMNPDFTGMRYSAMGTPIDTRVMANAPAMSKAGFARVQFAEWLEDTFPQLYREALERAENDTRVNANAKAIENANAKAQLSGIFDVATNVTSTATGTTTDSKSLWERFSEGALALGTTYLSLKNQRDLVAINLERAKAGQAPLDASTMAPVIKTQIDMDPELAARLASNVGSGLNRTLLIGGAVALLAILFLGRKK